LVFQQALLPQGPQLLADGEGDDFAQHAHQLDAAVVVGASGVPFFEEGQPLGLLDHRRHAVL
jgi:hypothetical protein